jgi:hypothetical protein
MAVTSKEDVSLDDDDIEEGDNDGGNPTSSPIYARRGLPER